MKLPQQPRVYPKDTNLIEWIFLISRNSDLLYRLLIIIEFIRDHPDLSEEAMRREYRRLSDVPQKPTGSS